MSVPVGLEGCLSSSLPSSPPLRSSRVASSLMGTSGKAEGLEEEAAAELPGAVGGGVSPSAAAMCCALYLPFLLYGVTE